MTYTYPNGRSGYSVVIVPSEHCEVFREAAEAVHFGLRALGHDSVLVDRSSVSGGRIPILLGWNMLAPDAKLPPDAILYNLEQPGSHWLDPARLERFKGLQFWDWHHASTAELLSYGHIVKYVPLGYVPEWTRIPTLRAGTGYQVEDLSRPARVGIDVLFYGSMNVRRDAVMKKLITRLDPKHSGKVVWLYRKYGAERDDYIAHSKVVLNMHYADSTSRHRPCLEVARVGYLLANRALVLSEESSGAEGFDGLSRPEGVGIDFQPYYQLVRRACELVLDHTDEERAAIAEKGYEAIVKRPMTEFLKGVV